MNETTLLEYGLRELPAFRADMRELGTIAGVNRNTAAAHLRVILRNANARRAAAGLTRTEAERACVLAAKAERSTK